MQDRTYCGGKHSIARRSALTTLHHILSAFTQSMAPIVPHLAEVRNIIACRMHGSKDQQEVHQFRRDLDPCAVSCESIFKEPWTQPDPAWQNVRS